MKNVWYVAYGSNLGLRRFRCYLAGGRPAGGRRRYAGCRDGRDPQRDMGVVVHGGLVFSGDSGVWGGGVAFWDSEAPGQTACRAYLVTSEQLADVAAQEMLRPPGGDHARALVEVLDDVDELHALGAGKYETIARLGELDGAPMFTVTHDDASRLAPAPPTAAYLRSICVGLHEAHGWGPDEVADYLLGARGVAGTWNRGALRELAETATAGPG